MMVSGGITKDGLSKGKVDPCGVCRLRAEANLSLCLQCGRWILHRFVSEKSLTVIHS